MFPFVFLLSPNIKVFDIRKGRFNGISSSSVGIIKLGDVLLFRTRASFILIFIPIVIPDVWFIVEDDAIIRLIDHPIKNEAKVVASQLFFNQLYNSLY